MEGGWSDPSVGGKAGGVPGGWYHRHSCGWSMRPSWWGGVGHGGRREVNLGLVLIPLLIAPIFVGFVVVLCVGNGEHHGRADQVFGVINSMTPEAMPLTSRCYLLKLGS